MSQSIIYEDLPLVWQDVHDALPPLASRQQIFEISGVPKGTQANHDCKGTGVRGKKMLGKTVVYPRFEVVLWLMKLAGEAPEVDA